MGVVTSMADIDGREASLQTQLAIIASIKQALAQDQTVPSNRVNAKNVLNQAAVNAEFHTPFDGCASQDRDKFIATCKDLATSYQ